MKPAVLYPFIFLTGFFMNAKAQSIQEQMTKARPSCYDVFGNAVVVLPKLYRQQAFDSMHTAVQIWEDACGSSQQVRCTKLLLALQEGTFHVDSLDSDVIDLLENYALSFSFYKTNSAQYYVTEKAFYSLSSIWAKFLVQQKTLDDNEKFICAVFTGEITAPSKQIKNNAEKYPELGKQLQHNRDALRKGPRVNSAFILGIWMPKGDLTILGNHPSIGFQFGARDNHHQLDFTMQFRFIKSANTYFFKRNNLLYESSHYFGGYIGIDYTYYFVSKRQYDLGLLTGIGFDGFDVASGQHNQQQRPLSINSFNANGGIKYNWFVSPGFYLGLQGRYNLVNYCNSGATSLQGNAFSIDFIIGGNGKKP